MGTCAGVVICSLFIGFPWGFVSMILWILYADLWNWNGGTSGVGTFPSRFMWPYLLLPFGVAATVAARVRREAVSPFVVVYYSMFVCLTRLVVELLLFCAEYLISGTVRLL